MKPKRPTGARTVPTRIAALALGVSDEAIRQMAHRGQLTRHGTSRRAMYDVAELLAVRQGRAGRLDVGANAATV